MYEFDFEARLPGSPAHLRVMIMGATAKPTKLSYVEIVAQVMFPSSVLHVLRSRLGITRLSHSVQKRK